MLRSFRFANHRSFRDEQELVLIPAYDRDRQAVPVAAVYGANAAGKSNLLDALRFMVDAVRDSYRSWPPDSGVPRCPFKLAGPEPAGDSMFVVEVLIDGVRHTYGFTASDERVDEEWLYAYPHRNRKRVIFERHGPTVTFGSTLTEQKSKVDVLADLTRPSALFLSLAAQVGLTETQPTYRWFTESLAFSAGPAIERHLTSAVAEFLAGGSRNQARLLDLLRAADLGIVDLVLDEDSAVLQAAAFAEWTRQRAEARLNEARAAGVEKSVLAAAKDLLAARVRADVARLELTRMGSGRRLRLIHGDKGEQFDLGDESAGTRAWLSMLPSALTALDAGSPFVIDEIDSSLHPELTARLIRLFQSIELNPRGAQLIFTTHDATLLGTSFGEELLGRDQVWFVEKDADGASRLYPLTDFHPRQNENWERRYLSGSYGAVPITSDLAVERAIGTDREAG
jgi:hypothetical protein